ncbi:L,D-transpeptidase family protein [Coralloluteibacterium stylophorae]|uniref:Murein L,D-transpeptidase n=1 Tax=Coralloluteibacterium stylophorae TaxID=1776034 RepID=A0A8J7VRP5_9GAMM|nr:L,D-transpeptidase family protein [Coralloluteibacterium stylophorae]MBS7457958.1 murein L,D-transpeptidase [Coralloluteibacterium stylophorae]
MPLLRPILTAVLLMPLALPIAAQPAPPTPGFDAAAVDAAGEGPVDDGAEGPVVLRAQVLLDRARFSPGEIDGRYGSNMRRAIEGFQRSRDLPVSGEVDAATWAALDDGAPALADYTVAEADVTGPFRPLPEGMMARADMDGLGYESAAEALGERFHVAPAVLEALNPGADLATAGTVLRVPNVVGVPPLPEIESVEVSAGDSVLRLRDAQGAVVAQFPASSGSEHDPLPIGEWTINGVGREPVFEYDPSLFHDADPGDREATLPPGPNNPVGPVWVDLSKPHYGIHGTPEPAHVGKTQSHGCIRLTNWSAQTVADAVRPGMTAELVP